MKKYLNISKVRVAIASAVAIALSVLSIVALQEGGMTAGKFALALFLSILAGLLIIIRIPVNKIAGGIIFFILPLLALCCMEFYTHVPWDLTFPILILNC